MNNKVIQTIGSVQILDHALRGGGVSSEHKSTIRGGEGSEQSVRKKVSHIICKIYKLKKIHLLIGFGGPF